MLIERRNYIWLVPLLLAVTYPLWRIPLASFLAPRGGYDPAYANMKTNVHNFVLQSPTIFEFKNSKKTAVINAEKAYSSPNPDEYILEKVSADIFNLHGEATHIVAQKGIFHGPTSMLSLSDNVVVDKKADNQQLYSELLYYDDNKRTVTCPGQTKLVGDDIEINGSSFFYSIENGEYIIGGRVHCIINGFDPP